MRHYHVRVTTQARHQLNDIRSYITYSLFAPDNARQFIDDLYAEMNALSEMPERVRLVDEEPWKSLGIRKKSYKNYFIYFLIIEEKKQVQIVAVIYAKMDQSIQLKKIMIN